MTTDQTTSSRPIISDRSMSMCVCPRHPDGALPESAVRLTVAASGPSGDPLPNPFVPGPGALALDTATKRIGVFMAFEGGEAYLRPERGGQEWTTNPKCLSRPPVNSSARAAA